MALVCLTAAAHKTLPVKGTFVSPADTHIQYTGRISLANPERPAWNFPGIQITALQRLAAREDGGRAHRLPPLADAVVLRNV